MIKKKAVRLKDIARETGVSITTVSHVINKTRHVNSATRTSVLEAMKRLDYDPKTPKKRNSKESGIIGVIAADLQEDLHLALVKAIETTASENGLSLLVCDSEMDPQKELKNIRTFLSKRVSGIIISPIDSRFFPDELRDASIPVVLVDRQYDNHNRTFAGINNFESAALAHRHLSSKGCQNIGFIGYAEYFYTVSRRVAGYRHEVFEVNPDVDPKVLFLRYRDESADERISEFLGKHALDGLICATSDICYQTVGVLEELGIPIPERMKILTYDDNKWLDYLRYPVSVISQPTAEIASFAVEKIIDILQFPERENRLKTEVLFDVSLIDR